MWRGGGGGTEQSFVQGCSSPRSKPLPFYIPLSTKNFSFNIPSVENGPPLKAEHPRIVHYRKFSTGMKHSNHPQEMKIRVVLPVV